MLRILLAALLASSAIASALPEAEASRGGDAKVIRVKKGQKIQDAIKSAPPNSRIIVEGGRYQEQLTITTDGIILEGRGAVLYSGGTPVENACSGFSGPNPAGGATQAGICVAGEGLELDKYAVEHRNVRSVRKPVKNVEISGFTVEGFYGFNILVLGAENTYVHDNVLKDNAVYGFLTAGSRGTTVSKNRIKSGVEGFNFVALCMDNFGRVKVTKNKITDYFIGLCVQTDGAEVEDNDVSKACFGAFLDPGVKNIRLRGNYFHDPIANCGAFGSTSAGISIDGTIGARVEKNTVERWKSESLGTAGIAIVDDDCTIPSLSCIVGGGGPFLARDNRVKDNKLRDNDLDIFVGTAGSGNVVQNNRCSTSLPDAGLCRSRR